MRKILVVTGLLLLCACAPVLDRDLMKEGALNPSLSDLRANPEPSKGKLFILGGLIVQTRFVQDGSQLEVLSLPVDSKGYLKDSERTQGRFLAYLPKDRGLLDPVVYKKGRAVTIAGVFSDIRKAKIDDLEYPFPVFEIRQIYLWEEQTDVYPVYPYYPYNYYNNPYWYNPYWGGPWGPPPPGWWW